MSPSVSVIIPTYNRADFLQEALDSVQAQTLAPLEVIVVDDGSTDGTLDALMASELPHLHILSQERRGPAAARNLALDAVRGDYVAFLDSDDLWLPEKLRVQADFMEANPEIRFCQTEELWIRRGVRVNPMKKHAKPSGWIFAACLPFCVVSPSAVMMERKFLLELGGFDPAFPVCEDYELWLRASLKSPFRTLDQALTVKRGGHEDQLSRAEWGMDRFRVQALEKLLSGSELDPEHRRQAEAELLRKLKILSKGFAKRYPDGHDPYEEKIKCLEISSR
ncbi:MAG: glycosyltransferase family 2 protein [Deltaproteobacteria bacterium]|nr:glycosyltransferase family 2 protein [Deltaproteobacteria bacterium]